MRWGPVQLPYAATLFKPLRDATRERYVVRPCAAPTLQGDELRWDCRHLRLQAHWTARVPAIRRKLLETAEGSVDWCCHLPCAEAHVDLGGADRISGLGYAEQLSFSVKPWRLPLERLRWGRFLSPEDAVTWIEWRGEEPRQWVFHNGVELRGAKIGDGYIELPDDLGIVELQDDIVLREGRLISTALRAVPAARMWLPAGIRNAYEAKWLARGTFTARSRSNSGWAIHEVVRLR
jgi:hypothetical protein